VDTETEIDNEGEILNLRALARAVLLQRQPERSVVYMGEDRQPIYDPFARYAAQVAVLPQKLSAEEWQARYGHLAGQRAERRSVAPSADVTSAGGAAPTVPQRDVDPTSAPAPPKAAGPVGLRRRSGFRP
jgi:hypothetical protein